MGLWRQLFGSKWKPTPTKIAKAVAKAAPAQPKRSSGTVPLAGDGTFEAESVGESFYQDALDAICGGKCEDGHEFECQARLLPEPSNPYDADAVAIVVAGRKVAHLSRSDAKKFHRQVALLGGSDATCDALITGGWKRRSGDEGHYGVALDVIWPLQRA